MASKKTNKLKAKVISISSRKRVNMPVAKSKSALQRLDDAFLALGVTREQVESTPVITHILVKALNKNEQKAKLKAIEFLRGSTDPDARRFLDVYDDLPESTRLQLPVEAFTIAAGLSTDRILEVIFTACRKQSDLASEMLTAAAQPDVLSAVVRGAKKGDTAASKMLLNHSGFLPVPKTQIVSARGNINVDNSQHATIAVGELGSVDKAMANIADRFNEKLGLTASTAPEVIDAEVMNSIPHPTEEDENLQPTDS